MTLEAPPLPRPDTDPVILQAARRRVTPKKSFSLFKRSSQPNRKHLLSDSSPPILPRLSQNSRHESQLSPAVDLQSSPGELSTDRDIYRWAVLYENQRGLTILSTQLYSSLSLLPTDPPPFTVPGADGTKKTQPEVSLSEYPLPDGSWEWVSSTWMIDMRDNGETSYDGFEYNWVFRAHKWRPDCKFGGFVRRRCYVRLMVRRGKALQPHSTTSASYTQSLAQSSTSLRSAFDYNHALSLAAGTWKGDEHDWSRCYSLMRYLPRDGVRLEIWRTWFDGALPASLATDAADQANEGCSLLPNKSTRPDSRATEAATLRLSHNTLERITNVIREHHQDLFAQFVYPESKAELARLLLDYAGLDIVPVDISGLQLVDFYSYTSSLSASGCR